MFMVGCSDDTDSVGNNLINPNEKFSIADTTLFAVRDTVFNVSSANGYGGSTVAGKSADMEAKAWLRFVPGTVPDSIKACTIDSVEMHLTVAYTWNAPVTGAEFEVREALSGWTQGGLTRDSLSLTQIGSTVLGRIADSLVLNRELTVLLDTTSARRWITWALDATQPVMNGYVITAKQGTTPGAFGFYSSTSTSLYPEIVIHYYDKTGKRDSLTVTTSEDTFIATSAVTTQPRLEVRGGVSTWSKLAFNASGLAASAVINNATLELTQDPSATLLGTGTTDSVYAFLSRTGGGPSLIDSTFRLNGKRKTGTSPASPVYEFTVTKYMQYLIAPGSPYDGIVIQAGYNTACVDHMTFHTSKDADPAKRPRLLLTYSK